GRLGRCRGWGTGRSSAFSRHPHDHAALFASRTGGGPANLGCVLSGAARHLALGTPLMSLSAGEHSTWVLRPLASVKSKYLVPAHQSRFRVERVGRDSSSRNPPSLGSRQVFG